MRIKQLVSQLAASGLLFRMEEFNDRKRIRHFPAIDMPNRLVRLCPIEAALLAEHNRQRIAVGCETANYWGRHLGMKEPAITLVMNAADGFCETKRRKVVRRYLEDNLLFEKE